MGLFDIFKRRSKQADKKKTEEKNEEELNQQTDSEKNEQANVDQVEDQTTSENRQESKNDEDNTEDTGTSSETDVADNKDDVATLKPLEPAKPEESTEVEEQADESTTEVNTSKEEDALHTASKMQEPAEKHEDLVSETSTSDQPVSEDKPEIAEVSSTTDNTNPISSMETIDSETSETDSKTSSDDNEEDLTEIATESTSSVDQQPETTEAVEAKVEDSESAESADIDESEPVTEAKEEKYEQGLTKSRTTFGQKLNALFANFRSVDEEFFDRLEDMLIESDVGFETSMRITDELRDEVKLQNAKKPKDVQNVIVQKMIEIYDSEGNGEDNSLHLAETGPSVLLFVGVNGVGKTTTIGKLAKRFKNEGKKVLLVAADTFRAGAIEQLNVWAQRDGVDIVKNEPGSDPAAAVFDGVKKAKAEAYDILLVDTAGRLQNKVNLMNELAKMKKILTREIPDSPHEVLLVLDATTGQNAMTQAKTFKETTDVSGIVLTKLDGTAKGGIVLAIRNELHLPVKLVGLGEKVTDLADFDPNNFVYGLFKGLFKD